MSLRDRLSIVILTFNEEVNLPACLASLSGLDCTLCVVDSGSTDGTIAIAQAAGAIVLEHPFDTHTQQWAWALPHVPVATPWVLALDADQQLTPALRDEIAALFAPDDPLTEVAGFYINRRQVFRGQWIRHGGYYPKYLLKLFCRDRVWFDPDDLVDHHFYVTGPTRQLRNDLIEANRKEDDLSFWLAKHDRYAKLLASEEWQRWHSQRPMPVSPSFTGTPDQRTLWFKRVWWQCPRYVRPVLYFLYRYIVRLGFLDGKEGFVFHFLQALWFRLLIDIRLDELERSRSQPVSSDPMVEIHK
jgi:glycosyltransferase involved in cell wall biosynthesis